MPDRLAAATDPKLTAAALMMEPLLTLSPKDDANKAQISFEIYGLDYLPVIDGGKFIGFVPKTRFEPAPAAGEATA
ncbi:MAG: CBS domain-containing protein [Victivallis sp.]